MLACSAAIQGGNTAFIDMKITTDLFHGLLGSMGQLNKTFLSLWVHAIHHYSPI